MPDTDLELAGRVREDPAALETLLARHLPALRAFVHLRAGGVVRAREEVSDLVQSVCREVLIDLPAHPFDDELHFRRWLYQAAMRKILDRHRYWRAIKRDGVQQGGGTDGASGLEDLVRTAPTPSRVAVGREELARAEEAFGQLPEDYREVILLSKLCGASHAEIAEKLGRSEGATRVLLSRALSRLAAILDEDEASDAR